MKEGDHLTLLNVYTAFTAAGQSPSWCGQNFVNFKGLLRATAIRDQLKRILERYKIPLLSTRGLINETEKIRQCLVKGFFAHAARLHHSGEYRTIRDDFPLKLYKGSSLMYRKELPEWIIFGEVLADSVRDVSEIDFEWLHELAPNYYEFGTVRLIFA